MDVLERKLLRMFYFAEAMALYELYAAPAGQALADDADARLLQAVRSHPQQHDRPLIWVPFVFHCTTREAFEGMVRDGYARPPVSFSELPIWELDRLRLRRPEPGLVAIGFPRRCAERHGATPVLYTRHNRPLRRVLENIRSKHPAAYDVLEPYVDLDGDVGAFLELRVNEPIPIWEAAWVLVTPEEDEIGKPPNLPPAKTFAERWGHITTSTWDRVHQTDILGEWQFVQIERDPDDGRLIDFRFIGEYWWKRANLGHESKRVRFPAARAQILQFRARGNGATSWDGPMTFYDAAKLMRSLLLERVPGHEFPNSHIRW